jgi:hypothetical protein
MLPPFFCLVVNWFPGYVFSCALRVWILFSPPSLTSIQHTARDGRICKSGERHDMYFYRTFMHRQVSWVIMKKGSVIAAMKCIFQKSSVMSPTGSFCRTGGMNHFAIGHADVGTTLLPIRGSWSASPSGSTTKQPASPMGETGWVAATMQEVIDGCGFDAPPIGEGFVDYPEYYSTIWGKGVGRGSERRGRWLQGRAWPRKPWSRGKRDLRRLALVLWWFVGASRATPLRRVAGPSHLLCFDERKGAQCLIRSENIPGFGGSRLPTETPGGRSLAGGIGSKQERV